MLCDALPSEGGYGPNSSGPEFDVAEEQRDQDLTRSRGSRPPWLASRIVLSAAVPPQRLGLCLPERLGPALLGRLGACSGP